MTSDVDSGRASADTTLLFNIEEPFYDPAEIGGRDNDRLAIVWPRSDFLRKLLVRRAAPDADDRLMLKGFLITQLQTLFLYWQIGVFLRELTKSTPRARAISLYVILFPGEARDNTGVKDLNDKVIGQWWNAQFQQRRYDAIRALLDVDGFYVAAQSYKTAFIITYTNTRQQFRAKLALLDEALRIALIEVMQQAIEDPTHPPSKDQQKEIRTLTKKLSKKGYRFDIYFGLRHLAPTSKSALENVYLLVTEALKAAALSRYVAKSATLSRAAKQIAAQARVQPDAKKLDPRGKEYDWSVYFRTSNQAEKIKDAILRGTAGGLVMDLIWVYVDTVWTTAYLPYKNLYWGNPDVMRDVRKKKLKPPPKSQGGAEFRVQKDLLELWLVVLNLMDFVKSFKSEEFANKVATYHAKALESFTELGENRDVDWDNLVFVLTHDLRQQGPIAVIGTACEFQFYATVSDYRQRIFLSMDIRDMGVDLLLDYEVYNREIGHNRYSDLDLMWETLFATDNVDERRRVTYDNVGKVTRKYYDQLRGDPAGARREAARAFGASTDDNLGSFDQAVQIMLGGDEVYVALHPLFAQVLPTLIGEVAQTGYGESATIDLRTSVAFSSAAKKDDRDEQRKSIQLSHQEALKIAEQAPALLKRLEQTDRRIERLIEIIEANDAKKIRAPGYRKELDDLGLRRLFARAKYGNARQLTRAAYQRLLAALVLQEAGGDPKNDDLPDLVDFTGKVVDYMTLKGRAAQLEDKVRKDVGAENVKRKAPPLPGSALAKKLFDKLRPKDPKKKKP
jgi:hypothetical protein